jgi:hypothetical protein
MDNLFTGLVALLDTFSRFGIQKYCKDYIYLVISYNSGSITCLIRYICCPSQNIRSLGHVLDMLDHIRYENGPKNTDYLIHNIFMNSVHH